MTDGTPTPSFEEIEPIEPTNPTLIEGLPGLGLVAAIAVDAITTQLELEYHGSITSEEFPPVVTFQDGLVQDLVRVYASTDPNVLTLQSDLALPPSAFEPLASCVIEDIAPNIERAIFVAGAPAETEEEIGSVFGIATDQSRRSELEAAGIEIHEDPGLVGGITGALVNRCHQASIPSILLIVHAHPFLPDPAAAKAVIETAIEPLVAFDIDTTSLDEQAAEIQAQKQQIAEQFEQYQRQEEPAQAPGMYQ